MAQSRARVRDEISSTADHFLYISIYLMGAALVFTLRLYTTAPTWLVLLCPLSLMGLYVYLVWKTERFRVREDRAADNIYYLGFLFTVTTLMVSLVRYQVSDNPDVNSIIGDLGLGLITTVFGLIGRIFFGQLRQDPEEIEERGRAELSTAVDESRKQINNMTEQVALVQAQAIQMMLDAKELIDVTNNGVVQSIKSLESRIEAIVVPGDLITSRLEPVIDNLRSSIELVASRLEAIEISPDLIGNKVSAIFVPLIPTIDELRESFKSLDKDFRKLPKRTEDLLSFAQSSEKLLESRDRLIGWFDAIAENQRKLSDINACMDDAVKSFNSVEPTLAGVKDKASELHTKYSESVSAMNNALLAAQKEVERMSADIGNLADEFSRSMTVLVRTANSQIRN